MRPRPVSEVLGADDQGEMLESMRPWELWESEGESIFFPASSEKNRAMAKASGAAKTRETDGSNSNEAMQAFYDR